MQECRAAGARPDRQRIVAVALDGGGTGAASLAQRQNGLLHDSGLGRIERRRPEAGHPAGRIRLDLHFGHHRGAWHRGVIGVHRHALIGAEQSEPGQLDLARQKHVPGGERAERAAAQEAEPVLLQLGRGAGRLPYGVAGEIVVPPQLVAVVPEDFGNAVARQKPVRIDIADGQHPFSGYQAGAQRLDSGVRGKELVVADHLDIPAVHPHEIDGGEDRQGDHHVRCAERAPAPQIHGTPRRRAHQGYDQGTCREPRGVGGKGHGPVGLRGAEDRGPAGVEAGAGCQRHHRDQQGDRRTRCQPYRHRSAGTSVALCQYPLDQQGREKRKGHDGQVRGQAGSPEILQARHHRVEQSEDGGSRTQRVEERHARESGQTPPPPITLQPCHGRNAQHEHQRTAVLGVVLERVLPPVRLRLHVGSGEFGNEQRKRPPPRGATSWPSTRSRGRARPGESPRGDSGTWAAAPPRRFPPP